MKVRRILGARRRPVALFVVALAAAAIAGIAAAATPGVDPQTVTNTVNPGDSFNVAKTVHTPVIPPNPDVVFLADTTGSMASTLANVQANATPIMNAVAAAPGVGTPAFAAAQYKDFNIPANCIPSSAFPFQIDHGNTTSTSDVQTAINTWSASGGCDTPEAQINALWELAQPGAGVFRGAGTSTRIIVWFGDATGHDPSGGHTIGDAISALQAAKVKVIAVPVDTTGSPGGGDGLNAAGQAAQITSQTGGVLLSSTLPGDVSNAILQGLQNLPVTVSHTETCDPDASVSLTPTSPENVISGNDVTYNETVSVASSNPGGVTLHCTVTFLLNGVSGGPDFTESISVTVNGADLAVVKTGPALVTEGHDLTYHLAATNNGPAAATGVVVSDTLPTNSTFVSASAGCTEAAGVVTCTVGNLASGASAGFDITVTAGSAGTSLTDTASIDGDQFDPNLANNTSTLITTLNHNPICTAVNGGPDLWPPNHKMHLITLTGATDPDGDVVTLTVTGVTQDEPLNGPADGNTSPDATPGPASNQVNLRAERAGTGDGRVYRIGFSGSDGRGGSCTGTATVGVPHDQGNGNTPIDSGGIFVDF
jgi:uncharacterized repeat protein (TIGR01451 family)